VRYIHNSFLYVAAKLGFIGLTAWAAIIIQLCWMCVVTYTESNNRSDQLMVVALVLCVLRMVASGYTEPWLMLDAGLGFVATALAIMVCIRRVKGSALDGAAPASMADSREQATWGVTRPREFT
jgi:O-antigen ligase